MASTVVATGYSTSLHKEIQTMGNLSLNVGNTTVSRSSDNADLLAVANVIYDYYVLPNLHLQNPQTDKLPSSPQEKLQAVVDWTALHLRDLAREAKRRELSLQRAAEDAAEVAALDL